MQLWGGCLRITLRHLALFKNFLFSSSKFPITLEMVVQDNCSFLQLCIKGTSWSDNYWGNSKLWLSRKDNSPSTFLGLNAVDCTINSLLKKPFQTPVTPFNLPSCTGEWLNFCTSFELANAVPSEQLQFLRPHASCMSVHRKFFRTDPWPWSQDVSMGVLAWILVVSCFFLIQAQHHFSCIFCCNEIPCFNFVLCPELDIWVAI